MIHDIIVKIIKSIIKKLQNKYVKFKKCKKKMHNPIQNLFWRVIGGCWRATSSVIIFLKSYVYFKKSCCDAIIGAVVSIKCWIRFMIRYCFTLQLWYRLPTEPVANCIYFWRCGFCRVVASDRNIAVSFLIGVYVNILMQKFLVVKC